MKRFIKTYPVLFAVEILFLLVAYGMLIGFFPAPPFLNSFLQHVEGPMFLFFILIMPILLVIVTNTLFSIFKPESEVIDYYKR